MLAHHTKYNLWSECIKKMSPALLSGPASISAIWQTASTPYILQAALCSWYRQGSSFTVVIPHCNPSCWRDYRTSENTWVHPRCIFLTATIKCSTRRSRHLLNITTWILKLFILWPCLDCWSSEWYPRCRQKWAHGQRRECILLNGSPCWYLLIGLFIVIEIWSFCLSSFVNNWHSKYYWAIQSAQFSMALDSSFPMTWGRLRGGNLSELQKFQHLGASTCTSVTGSRCPIRQRQHHYLADQVTSGYARLAWWLDPHTSANPVLTRGDSSDVRAWTQSLKLAQAGTYES